MAKMTWTTGKNKLYQYRIDYWKNVLFSVWPNTHYCSTLKYARTKTEKLRKQGYTVEIYKFPKTMNPFRIFIQGTKVR